MSQITAALSPQTLEIYNDSHLHAHHKPMQGSTSRETHFRCVHPLPLTASSPLLPSPLTDPASVPRRRIK